MQSVKENNMQKLKEFLQRGNRVNSHEMASILYLANNSDFLEAPASTRYHGSYPGGLFDHSMAVAELLVKWTDMGLIQWDLNRSPVVVGLLHDWTKVGKYTPKFDPEKVHSIVLYDYTPLSQRVDYGGHGSDSCIKLLQHIGLTTEELNCIRWHMGAYEKDAWDLLDAAVKRFPSVLWVHHADMVASKNMGV